MPNDLTQDPLVIDTNVTDVDCHRIRAVKFQGTTAQTVTIADGDTAHVLYSSTGGTPGPFDDINLYIASGLIDVTITGGTLYIYLGSGPQ